MNGPKKILSGVCLLLAFIFPTKVIQAAPKQKEDKQHAHHHHDHKHFEFSIRSVKDGKWSDKNIWKPARLPKSGDRVLISRETTVEYNVQSKEVFRMVQVVGTLSFARNVDTEMNVGILKIEDSDLCSENGFACDFQHEDHQKKNEKEDHHIPSLLVGTIDAPIPAKQTARIRLHYLEGMNKDDAPAVACCSARMEIHGAPLNRTWLKLADDLPTGEVEVTLSEKVTGWKIGDEVIITASGRSESGGTFRQGSRRSKQPQTEERKITKIETVGVKTIVTLDQPVKYEHSGTGEYRCEIANLSRNVIIESADPRGVRGHTVYHRHSTGGISYARFAHLGKEGRLGRYAIHYHLIDDTMRGSSLKGVSIVDSHNRWITIHGTQYLVVRDCVGYQSVGHGYFMEDGTEIYNLLDRNLAVQAYRGKRLPEQVLPFDPNDGAGFWWANGRNTITNNVTCENDEYGYRYDMQSVRSFNSNLSILQPDGSLKQVDVRTIPIWRFEGNEAHAEGFYGMVLAANGNSQPDSPISNERSLEYFKKIDWTGPDTSHPHMIRDLSIWGSHYAFRPHSPSMRAENVRIHKAAYGIYRPAFQNHEYQNLSISHVGAEPFNRGGDDASAQLGKITVDGLTFTTGYGNSSTPLVQISDLNLSGDAETHFRNVKVNRPNQFQDRWPLFNRGVGPRVKPITKGVPIYIHDYFGKNRHAKVVSTAARDLMQISENYREMPPLTAKESRVAEVKNVKWPKLLHPVDDVPPATIIISVRKEKGEVIVQGVSHDNGKIVSVQVNGERAEIIDQRTGIVDWKVTLKKMPGKMLSAYAIDEAGNQEQTSHQLKISPSFVETVSYLSK